MRHRNTQCAACPWKVATNPHTDIPNGYDAAKHARLIVCTAGIEGLNQPIRAMACHESKTGKESACVGWLVNQLGPGNNIALRLHALDGRFDKLKVIGEQHESLAEMCATSARTAGRRPSDAPRRRRQ